MARVSAKPGEDGRRETGKKRSIYEICEHFEPVRNPAIGATMGT